MYPINRKDIINARRKFLLFVVLTLAVVPVILWSFWQLPPPGLASVPPDTVLAVEDTFDQARIQSIEAQLIETADRLKKINLFFLIDATPDMEEQLPAIATAAEQLISTTQANASAACYRDAVEGAWLYMEAPAGGAIPRWIQRLSTDVQYDQDAPEAVYYGLQQALQSSAFHEHETNVLLLLGDAGNHAQEDLTKVSPEALRAALHEKNIHFAAVQVRNPGGKAYEQFGHQLLEDFLMPQVADFSQIQDSTLAQGLLYRTMSSPSYQLITCQASSAISSENLTVHLQDYITGVQSQVAGQLRTLEAAQAGTDSTKAPVLQQFDPSELAYLQAYRRFQEQEPRVTEGQARMGGE